MLLINDIFDVLRSSDKTNQVKNAPNLLANSIL